MNQLATKYDPNSVEDKIYDYWLKNKYFSSKPDSREPYTIVIPPPNVTGVLHMGHMLNNTIQDVLVRKARMSGKNACWVPGTDHASIATEAKVVRLLREQGIKKSDLSRDEFLRHAYDWKDKYGGIILEQLKKLGASCDWDRTAFTMDPDYYEAVIDVFVDLYNKGLIYRGMRMINWDPAAKTALSNEEVIYREVDSALYYISYDVCDKEGNESGEMVTIATTRPETIPADTAICVNPKDERFTHLHGKYAKVPLIGRLIPIITDTYVEMEFGTGCLKVTPAHDTNDYELGQKHGLDVIDIMNDDGTLNEKSILFQGLDRFEARKEIIKQFKESGNFLKQENLRNKVGFSERTDAVAEPKLSLQWFMNMKPLAKPALEVVMNDEVKFYPAKFKNTYRHWMENINDWCISRQLWWGHRIPAWYTPDGKFYVAKSAEQALILAQKDNPQLTAQDLKQDEDVLDTWASSWLWPIAVFDGLKNPNNQEINYYYPTNDLVTAPEIMFFWVARMIMAGIEYRGKIPFRNVYYTGIVRDKLGRKMSKSLGNSPDPLDLIAQYGADGVRVGMLLSSPAGNDLPFDESLCEQGRNFNNKIWNSFRLLQSFQVADIEANSESMQAIKWFESTLNQALIEINQHYENYRISDALMSIYKLVWDDYCSVYLEIIKTRNGQISREVFDESIKFYVKLLQILHPFTPFITEELWQVLRSESMSPSICVSDMPQPGKVDSNILRDFSQSLELIGAIRNFRNEKGISFKDELTLISRSALACGDVVKKLANINSLEIGDGKSTTCATLVVGTDEFYIPYEATINAEEEIKKLTEEMNYYEGFLKSVNAKLSNERFVQNAKPEVVEAERKKQADALQRIKIIETQLESLTK